MDLLPFRNLFKAIRGYSLTFACVFAFAILGVSIHALMRSLIGVLPIKGILLWIIPIILIMILAKLEPKLVSNEALRRKWSKIIVISALILVVAINGIRLRFGTPPSDPEPVPTEERAGPRGPRGK